VSVDLLQLTAELIDVPSVSYDEGPIADLIEAKLRPVPWLTVDRVGDNVVARTDLGRAQRLLLVGHTDTVPAADLDGVSNDHARIEGDVLWGLGASDMQGGIAVFLDLAATVAEPAVDVSYVFYACEEVTGADSGLEALFVARPDLLAGDAAILGEPTDGVVEAGCQGTMRLRVTLAGARAHTARPWMGRNAIHRIGRLLGLVEAVEERRPVLDGCEYREALQAVRVEGGVAGNVVPDRATVLLNHRFAPDRSAEEAEASVRALLAPALEDGDTFELVDVAAGAPPGLTHPLLASLVERLEVRAKLGWTDVARFAARGIPAVNLGPGDPLLAHTADERVHRESLESTRATLARLIGAG
jgi:succinyl-diaminopimelate desuccinylase